MRSDHRCCDKETFPTEQEASFHLKEIKFIAHEQKWEVYPQRHYICGHGCYHLTSASQEFADLWERYRQEAEERLSIENAKGMDYPNPVLKAISFVLERDQHRCVVCGNGAPVTTIIRGWANDVVQVKRMPPELRDAMRRMLPSNVITVCSMHAVMLKSQDFGWPYGWRLEKHHDPERMPLLYLDRWAFLTNRGDINFRAIKEV